ncbi:MAG TPA: hypothetical protein VM686_29445 [Polyangiaceae bacterium]|nr:hypothetical protein [Polyangiaceae bacterium]
MMRALRWTFLLGWGATAVACGDGCGQQASSTSGAAGAAGAAGTARPRPQAASRCVKGSDCASGFCLLPEWETREKLGRCVDGKAGSFCFGDQQCLSKACVFTPSPDSGLCLNVRPREICDSGGYCDEDARCQVGRCADSAAR